MSTKKSNPLLAILGFGAAGLLAACGGSSSSQSGGPIIVDPSDAARAEAARVTANSNAACATNAIGPFYWEIGDGDRARAGGSVGNGAPAADTVMSIASASKWVYASYVLQKVGRRGSDVPYLNFTSGYTEMVLPLCQVSDTVASCLDGKDGLVAGNVGRFLYGSGHMQTHAVSVMGLGAMDNAALTAEVQGMVGDFGFLYTQPQLAGGLVTDAAGYAAFLRRILRGELTMRGALGSSSVCTNPATCTTAIGGPIPDQESWSYSLGHWVENDPVAGDGAFSSAGALGFYPWIDSTRTYYGVLARRADAESNAGYHSAQCGRLIRQAWVTGVAVP
jgi:hypothetical protein